MARYLDHYAPDRTLADLEAERLRRLAELEAQKDRLFPGASRQSVAAMPRTMILAVKGDERRELSAGEAAALADIRGRNLMDRLRGRQECVVKGWTFTRVEQAKGNI